MTGYINEPLLKSILDKYPDDFTEEVAHSVVDYFQNKKNIRNGKPITDSSKVNQISTFKKVLKDIKILPELSLLKMPETIWKPVKTSQVAKTIANHRSILKIQNSEEFIKKTLEGLHSKLFSELYPALLLASGRRPTEIYMMKFRKGKKPNTIIFTGQLKKRSEKEKYVIPLLTDVITFKKAIKNFQQLFPEVKINNMTPDQIAKAYSKQNANTLLAFSKKNGIKLKASDFRRIYVAKSYKDYSEANIENTQTFNVWIMDFLGHVSLDISLNYSNVILE